MKFAKKKKHRISPIIYLYFALGQTTQIMNFSLLKLLPETRGYITYEGSMTEPGCQETVTWVIMNRPIYVTPQQVICYKYGCSSKRYKTNGKPLRLLITVIIYFSFIRYEN